MEDIIEAIHAFRETMESPEFKEAMKLRERAMAEEESARANARHKERIAIAEKRIKRGRPIEEIAEDTGLTLKEVEELRG
ncbi:MAG: hypothetical protein FWH07_02565 [Oscillospiraceae bacterium]|nr:hypothetical protein [Oscillospiraceae bacterium]